MKYLRLLSFGVLAFTATATTLPTEAGAVVCARGVYRAGCAVAAPRRVAVVAPRPVVAAPRPVVVAPRVRVYR
nr:hypothetical protein [Methylocystis sp. ATCC 49242]